LASIPSATAWREQNEVVVDLVKALPAWPNYDLGRWALRIRNLEELPKSNLSRPQILEPTQIPCLKKYVNRQPLPGGKQVDHRDQRPLHPAFDAEGISPNRPSFGYSLVDKRLATAGELFLYRPIHLLPHSLRRACPIRTDACSREK